MRDADAGRDREIEALFDEHYRSLRGLAFVFLGDAQAAEEIVMDAFLKTFSGWDRFRRIENRPAYLRQMVVNGCRGKGRRAAVEARGLETIGAALERRQARSPSDQVDINLDLWKAVKELPPRQRACIVLRYLDDLPEAEIAQILKISIGTVKSQLFKARAALEQRLNVPDPERGR